MGAEEGILKYLEKNPKGASISDISQITGHTRATAAKYLELMKLQNKVDFREIGKAKLWTLSQKKKKILIVEDEDHIRRLIRIILEPEGYSFVEAKNGKEALEKVSEEMPDLLILDLMMPKVDGIEVCKQLKKNALTKKIPVIMLTARRELSDKFVGIQIGADDYLTKPFEPRELRARVKTFLNKEQRERNLATNLPLIDFSLARVKGLDKNLASYYLFFENFESYKKSHGFSKANELVRLASHIISHNVERLSPKNFICHDYGSNFIIFVESKNSLQLLSEILGEFESTIPFFYDVDYENVDLKDNKVIKIDSKGKIEKIALIQLRYKQLQRDMFEKNDLAEQLNNARPHE